MSKPADIGNMEIMTNFQAFCKGFWSVWDFGRPFSQPPELFPFDEDIDVIRPAEGRRCERFGQNRGPWEKVGNYLREAMSQYENENHCNVPRQ